ncbi:hypothetical protein [Acinetobacter sp. MD2(2019)]|uniref:hypothetical protein n=1 Tax=Acinetobacter sp. MD2(2019) TaxID=2605273 RepID=UPI002D1F157B|nr:hypothetical protein [Acinetobacter sp. MD2(2019)]MEB3754379.1 hypothetical protein [Acinetobacter sp. MD2(2019)]
MKKLLLFSILFFVLCNSYAKDYPLTDNICIKSEVKNSSLFIYKSDCNKKKYLLDKFEVPNDIPEIDFVFLKNIKDERYIFISLKYSEDYRDETNKINYAGKYHLNYVYQCKKECTFDKKISNFLGGGGDLIDIHTKKVVYAFPYKTSNNVEKDLNSNFFKIWFNNQLNDGIVKNKTEIYEDARLNSKKIAYLISGDKFKIIDITSRWLNISYAGRNKKPIIGWIRCEDTNVCNNK